MGKWYRPLGSYQRIISFGALAILVAIVMPVALKRGDAGEIPALLIFAVFVTMVPVLMGYAVWGEVSDFTFKVFDKPSHRIMPRLEEALTARGVPFAIRDRAKRSPFKIKIDGFLDLNRGEVTIALQAREGTTWVFLGPVGPDNKVAIERLKDLIDGAVG